MNRQTTIVARSFLVAMYMCINSAYIYGQEAIPEATPEPAPAQTPEPTTPDNRYTVQPGDTLSALAKGTQYNQYILAGINKIPHNSKLQVGQKIEIRSLNIEEVEYIINITTRPTILDSDLRKGISDIIVAESQKYNIEPHIVLGIFGVETNFNPYVTAIYVPIRDKSNLPDRFNMPGQYVVAYDCRYPKTYHPDMGAMQISYKSAVGTLNLSPTDLCRLHHDPVFNIQQAIKLLSIKRTRNNTKDWYLYYHNADKKLKKAYAQRLDKVFYKMYLLLLERD